MYCLVQLFYYSISTLGMYALMMAMMQYPNYDDVGNMLTDAFSCWYELYWLRKPHGLPLLEPSSSFFFSINTCNVIHSWPWPFVSLTPPATTAATASASASISSSASASRSGVPWRLAFVAMDLSSHEDKCS